MAHPQMGMPSRPTSADVARDGLDVDKMSREPDRLDRRERMECMLFHGRHRPSTAASQFAPLPPGHRRTRGVVPIDGHMGYGGQIFWNQNAQPPMHMHHQYSQYSQPPMHHQHGQYGQPLMHHQYAAAATWQPAPIRPPLGFPLQERQATTGDSLVLRRTERTLAGRYHQLLLQHRTRLVHGPGLFCGPTMNVWPPPPPGYAYNTYSHHPHAWKEQVPPSSHYYGGERMGFDDAYDGYRRAHPIEYEYEDANSLHHEGFAQPSAADLAPVPEHVPPAARADDDFESSPPPAPPPSTARPPRKGSKIHAATPELLAQFLRAFDCIDADDPEHQARRREMFERFDTNGNGYISLAECGAGILLALSAVVRREATSLYHRYYRSYIRAFNDAKDAAKARAGHTMDDDYVTRSEFRLLLVYLQIYATWYEVFAHIIDTDGAPTAAARRDQLDHLRIEADHRMVREEWEAALPKVTHAGATWAPFLRLASARAADFDAMDSNRGGYVDFREFCEWIEQAEKSEGTAFGRELGVNEPTDQPAYNPDAASGPAPKEFSAGSAHAKDAHIERMRVARR